MGSTKTCTVDESLVTTYGAPYELDVRSLKGSTLDEIGSSSGSNEGFSPDPGLVVTSANMEANSFSFQTMTIKASTYNCSADIKGLKKPDKALPCPRCNSLDTKFCYYNNYNVNQPRHFCKGCQRYWTAGGTLRNVAVGAGRRKRKHSSHESESATTEATSVECSSAQEFLVDGSVMHSFCKLDDGFSPSKDPGVIALADDSLVHSKPSYLPFDVSSFLSNNLSSAKLQGDLTNELIQARLSLAAQHRAESLHSSHENREKASIFHEFLHSNFAASLSAKDEEPCNSDQHDYKSVDQSYIFNVHRNDEHSDVDSKLVLAMPSERQASTETGCASSLTSQAVSVDACISEVKSDVMDSEVTKEGGNCDRGCALVGGSLQYVHHVSRGGSAVLNISDRDVSSAVTNAPTALPWRGPLENPALGAAWAMQSMPLLWGRRPTDDRGLPWGSPWGPASSAVDAAKAALITNATALHNSPSKLSMESAQKTLMLSDKDSEKSGIEVNAPSEMRVWVPKTLRIKDADEAVRSSIWSTLGIRDKQGSLVSGKMEAAFQCPAKEVGSAAVKMQNANSAALSLSMTFQESS